MRRNEVKELLPIIQAFAEGKTIQVKAIDGMWYDDEDMLKFDSSPQNYRIKPNQSIDLLRMQKNVGKKCKSINHLDG